MAIRDKIGSIMAKSRARRPPSTELVGDGLDTAIAKVPPGDERNALEELKAARQFSRSQDAIEAEKSAKEAAEAENVRKAQAEGDMAECGCCFDKYPRNRMTSCDGTPSHWFCWECARNYANAVVGMGKYELVCMSTDACSASFAPSQRSLFLDDAMMLSLDRLEQEAMLRMAGIENLASCPFCPFAAEYPPVEEDKEFRCQNAECQMVSCRLCQKESHIPKTCAEAADDCGLSARRQVEEAMSAALIRRCNKCSTPFIKESGCNKMTCTKSYCRNMQCYMCGKNCSYDHFNDAGRGGKPGNCPLWDKVDIEDHHETQVKEAQEKMRKQVLEEHPELDEETLDIKMSEEVKKKPQKRARHGLRGGFGGLVRNVDGAERGAPRVRFEAPNFAANPNLPSVGDMFLNIAGQHAAGHMYPGPGAPPAAAAFRAPDPLGFLPMGFPPFAPGPFQQDAYLYNNLLPAMPNPMNIAAPNPHHFARVQIPHPPPNLPHLPGQPPQNMAGSPYHNGPPPPGDGLVNRYQDIPQVRPHVYGPPQGDPDYDAAARYPAQRNERHPIVLEGGAGRRPGPIPQPYLPPVPNRPLHSPRLDNRGARVVDRHLAPPAAYARGDRNDVIVISSDSDRDDELAIIAGPSRGQPVNFQQGQVVGAGRNGQPNQRVPNVDPGNIGHAIRLRAQRS